MKNKARTTLSFFCLLGEVVEYGLNTSQLDCNCKLKSQGLLQLPEIAAQQSGQACGMVGTAKVRRAQPRLSRQVAGWKRVQRATGIAQAVFPLPSRGPGPPSLCPALPDRALTMVQPRSQMGFWIGTDLEAQRPRCRHHPAPTRDIFPARLAFSHPHLHPHLHCTLRPRLLLKCRPSPHCRRRGGCHVLASDCHFGACSHTEEVRSPRSDNSAHDQISQRRTTRAPRLYKAVRNASRCSPRRRRCLLIAANA